MVYLGASVAQSLIHIASATDWAIRLRFTAFLVQFVCAVRMGVSLAAGLYGHTFEVPGHQCRSVEHIDQGGQGQEGSKRYFAVEPVAF